MDHQRRLMPYPCLVDPLTRRERRIAELVAQGHTNKQIAQALVISARTVQTHLTHIFIKCRINNRVQLATIIATTPDQR